MKDVKPGKWNNLFEVDVKCTEAQCGATFTAEEVDVKARNHSGNNDFYVKCPICGTTLQIPTEKIPLRVQEQLNKKRK